MIRHIVLLSAFARSMTEAEIADIFAELHATRRAKCPGSSRSSPAQSESPEKIERGYLHGFTVDFADWGALEAYQTHPDHKKLGARLVANTVGGLDGVLVFDLPVV